MSRTGARAFRGAFGSSRLEVGKLFAVQHPTARHASSSSSSRGARLGSGRSLQKGTVSPKATVPAHIALPPYAVDGTIDPPTPSIFDLRGGELVKMRAACAFTRDTLKFAGSLVRHGVTTDEIDAKVFQHVTSNGGYPSRKCVVLPPALAFLMYNPWGIFGIFVQIPRPCKFDITIINNINVFFCETAPFVYVYYHEQLWVTADSPNRLRLH
jgi:hypothetical protein